MIKLKRIFILSFCVLLIILSFATLSCYTAYFNMGPNTKNIVLIIPKGSGVERISQILFSNQIIDKPKIFRILARIVDRKLPLQAGEFSFPKSASMSDIFKILKSGKQVIRKLMIAEGTNNLEAITIINSEPGLVGIAIAPDLEGQLFPDTYHFNFGDSREDLVKRMKRLMQKKSLELWRERSSDLPFKNLNEVITLASIVEKETSIDSERGRIASVFLNRLKLNMRLQSDPTVIFGITLGKRKLERPLTRKDLKQESPFNTYRINGLPPSPIANPGLASITAVLNPDKTKDLYFVADGTGGHAFSQSLAEHNKNVGKWRKLKSLMGLPQ